MQEFIKLLIGVIILLLGIPIGNFLAKYTKEELKPGRKWFKLIIMISLIGGLIGLMTKNDVLLFPFLLINPTL